jgi:hypothetical protein
VTATGEGRLYLAEEPVSEEQLRDRLKEISRGDPAAAVAIRADGVPARGTGSRMTSLSKYSAATFNSGSCAFVKDA